MKEQIKRHYKLGYRYVVIDQSTKVRSYLVEYNGYIPDWGTAIYPINSNGNIGGYVAQNWDSSG